MYATVSRVKSNADPNAKQAASITMKSSNSVVRTAATHVRSSRSTPMTTPTPKSKYTERRSNAPTNPNNYQRNNNVSATNNANTAAIQNLKEKKKFTGSTPKRVWNRNNNKEIKAELNVKVSEKLDPLRYAEMGIQTIESEIIEYDLLIGDIKFMLPSKPLVNEIDRAREDARKKMLLKTQRKYEEHSEKESEHLSDLKEFLEKATITRKARKPPVAEIQPAPVLPAMHVMEVDKKLISSMDELLQREMPKTESITDIKSRIKKKEKELLTLFETVENVQIFSNKNS